MFVSNNKENDITMLLVCLLPKVGRFLFSVIASYFI